jgi:hypothetical protein
MEEEQFVKNKELINEWIHDCDALHKFHAQLRESAEEKRNIYKG